MHFMSPTSIRFTSARAESMLSRSFDSTRSPVEDEGAVTKQLNADS